MSNFHVLAEGDEVLTPIGPGTVFTVDAMIEDAVRSAIDRSKIW